VNRQSILVDLDDTLSDASWRAEMFADPLVSYDDAFEASKDDLPLVGSIRLMNTLGINYNFIILTARPVKWRQLTMKWLMDHHVLAEEVMMRPDGCFDPAPEIKTQLAIERFNGAKGLCEQVALVVDDREDVVAAFSELGVTAMQMFGRKL